MTLQTLSEARRVKLELFRRWGIRDDWTFNAEMGVDPDVPPEVDRCYWRLFTGAALEAAKELPALATGAQLRVIANSHKSPYALGSFGMYPSVVDGQAVWHVAHGDWTAELCLAMINGTALVGALGESAATAQDVSRQVHETAERVNVPATEIQANGGQLTRRFHVSFSLGGGGSEPVAYTLNPMQVPRIRAVARLFESVRLVNASFEIVVETSATGRVGIGLNGANTQATDMGSIRQLSHNMIAYGKIDGPKVSVWDLPAVMNFGREYKMRQVGNGPAYIAFLFSGAHSDSAEVNGFMEISFAGEGIVGPVRLVLPPKLATTGSSAGGRPLGASNASGSAQRGPVKHAGNVTDGDDDDDSD
jgi:hypothetical protein